MLPASLIEVIYTDFDVEEWEPEGREWHLTNFTGEPRQNISIKFNLQYQNIQLVQHHMLDKYFFYMN